MVCIWWCHGRVRNTILETFPLGFRFDFLANAGLFLLFFSFVNWRCLAEKV